MVPSWTSREDASRREVLFDLGLIAGAGIEVTRIGFEVRGEWGMLSIFDPAGDVEAIGDVKNVTLQMPIKLRIN